MPLLILIAAALAGLWAITPKGTTAASKASPKPVGAAPPKPATPAPPPTNHATSAATLRNPLAKVAKANTSLSRRGMILSAIASGNADDALAKRLAARVGERHMIPAAPSDRLLPGESLRPGARITSPNGAAYFELQSDGNTVIRETSGGRVLWASDTRVGGSLYDAGLMVDGEDCPERAVLVTVQADGNLVWRGTSGRTIAALSTDSASKPDKLLADGKKASAAAGAVAGVGASVAGGAAALGYGSAVASVAATAGTATAAVAAGLATAAAMVTPVGWAALAVGAVVGVVYLLTGGRASATITPGSTLVMQDDGNLVLYTGSGAVAWASGTDTMRQQPKTNSVFYVDPSHENPKTALTALLMGLSSGRGPTGATPPKNADALLQAAGLDPKVYGEAIRNLQGLDAGALAAGFAAMGVTPEDASQAMAALNVDLGGLGA